MGKEYYKLKIKFVNNDENGLKVKEDCELNREEAMIAYAVLVIKAKKIKKDWLEGSPLSLDFAEAQFDDFVERFIKEHYEEV